MLCTKYVSDMYRNMIFNPNKTNIVHSTKILDLLAILFMGTKLNVITTCILLLGVEGLYNLCC